MDSAINGYNNQFNRLAVEFKYKKGGDVVYSHSVCFDQNALVTDENASVWLCYLQWKVGELISEEAMRSDLFYAVEREVEEVQRRQRREIHKRELKRFPNLGFIPEGPDVDYAAVYGEFIDSAIQWTPGDKVEFLYQVRSLERMATKSVHRYFEQDRPDVAYALLTELLCQLPRWIQRKELANFFSQYKPRLRKLVRTICQFMTEVAICWNNKDKLNEANNLIERNQNEFVSWGLTPSDMLWLQSFAVIEKKEK